TQQPNGAIIPSDGGRYSDAGDSQGGGHSVRRHTIRNDGRKRTAGRFDIERAQLHQLVKRVVRRTRDVDAIGHWKIKGKLATKGTKGKGRRPLSVSFCAFCG